MLDIVAQESQRYGVRFTESQMGRMQQYHDLLIERSPLVNLIANTDSETIQRRHILESIALGAALREREILRPTSNVLDVGAGAGFPGLVLKIAWPQIELTLIEATAKKAAFLSDVVVALSLDETRVLTGRAEDLAHDAGLRGAFDLVVARAVAPLPTLLELTLPFARLRGHVATPKGSRAAAEVEAASRAATVLAARIFSIPFGVPGPPQTLVVARKDALTPPEFPRRPGLPAKRPL